jgi:hypothetical protein
MEVLGQERCHLLAKSSYKNAFLSHNYLLQLLEPVLFYVIIDVRILPRVFLV